MEIDKKNLKEVLENFISSTSFLPVFGAEIEFYSASPLPKDFAISQIEEEKGENQYEIQFAKTQNPIKLADDITSMKEALKKAAGACDNKVFFESIPFTDRPSSGMHIHISLLNKNRHNVFTKNGEDESNIMLYAIGGLLDKMRSSLPVFAPKKEDMERFRPVKCGENPTTISWGGNNRTVALRLPSTTSDPENRRIEHRVPAADANPYKVIACILEGIEYGITNKIKPSSGKMYGNASDEQYGLSRLYLS